MKIISSYSKPIIMISSAMLCLLVRCKPSSAHLYQFGLIVSNPLRDFIWCRLPWLFINLLLNLAFFACSWKRVLFLLSLELFTLTPNPVTFWSHRTSSYNTFRSFQMFSPWRSVENETTLAICLNLP